MVLNLQNLMKMIYFKNDLNNEINSKLKDKVNKIEIIENKYNEIIKYKDLINNIEKQIEKINKEKDEEYKNNIINDIKIFKEEIDYSMMILEIEVLKLLVINVILKK